jgi:hypothetical protein
MASTTCVLPEPRGPLAGSTDRAIGWTQSSEISLKCAGNLVKRFVVPSDNPKCTLQTLRMGPWLAGSSAASLDPA